MEQEKAAERGEREGVEKERERELRVVRAP